MNRLLSFTEEEISVLKHVVKSLLNSGQVKVYGRTPILAMEAGHKPMSDEDVLHQINDKLHNS